MYQRHSFGAPPPIFTPPPTPYNPKHRAYATGKQPTSSSDPHQDGMMNAKDYEAEWKWMNSSPEAKQRSDAAKAQALSEFKKRFPRADMSKFIVQDEFDSNRKATARVLFPDGDGSWENALIEDRKYWSQPLKDALGVNQDGGFPYQLSLLQQNKPQPVPAIDFSDSITQSIADIFNKEIKST